MVVSGQITTPIVLKAPTYSTNSEGGREVSHAATITTHAKVKDGGQSRESEPATIAATKVFTIRWRSAADAITKDWLLTYRDEDYTIHAIKRVDEQDKFIEITAKVRTDG